MRYISVRREIEGALPTVMELLRKRGENDALRVMAQAEIDLQETGYDNWNGGTEIWTAYLRIPVPLFVSVESARDQVAQTILKNLELVVGRDRGFCVSVEISPAKMAPLGQKISDGRISDRTRAAVLDEMRARGTVWFGALDEVDYLGRIFDHASLAVIVELWPEMGDGGLRRRCIEAGVRSLPDPSEGAIRHGRRYHDHPVSPAGFDC